MQLTMHDRIPPGADMAATSDLKEIRETYDLALDWIDRRVGLPNGTRLLAYRTALETLAKTEDEAGVGKGLVPYDWLTALYEASDVNEIYKGMIGESGAGLDKRLRELTSGTEEYVSERPETKTNLGRNAAFELFVASMYRRAGYEVSLEQEADVLVEFCNKALFVECKRPYSERGLKSVLDSANKQVVRRFQEYGPGALGIVAVSFSRLVNPEFKFLGSKDGLTPPVLREELHRQIRQRGRLIWNSISRHQSLLAVQVVQTAIIGWGNHSFAQRFAYVMTTRHEGNTAHSIYLQKVEDDLNRSLGWAD